MIPFVILLEQRVASLLQKVKIFDDDSKPEHLRDFTTFNSDVSVNVMAT